MSLNMNEFRPIISGIIGAILAAFLSWLVCSVSPDRLSSKKIAERQKVHGESLRFANRLSLTGFAFACYCILLASYPQMIGEE